MKSRIWLCLAILAMLASCDQQKTSLVLDENAPDQFMRNATIQHTDSGRIQMILWGEEIWNYEDEDQTQEFPKNVKATFYDVDGSVTTIITANEATSWQRKKLMNLRGNVIITDLRDGKITYTEDFWWDQDKEEVYSNVDVLQVNQDGSKIRGTGFRANERMEANDWVIYNSRFSGYI